MAQNTTAQLLGILGQWRTGVWRSGGHMGYEERKSPSGVQGQNSVGCGSKPPEARYAYTICNWQTHFPSNIEHWLNNTVDSLTVNFTTMHLHTIPKTLRISPNPKTHSGRDWVSACPTVPSRGYATDFGPRFLQQFFRYWRTCCAVCVHIRIP